MAISHQREQHIDVFIEHREKLGEYKDILERNSILYPFSASFLIV